MDGAGVLAVAREVQIPLLAVLLIGGCATKARRAHGARSIDAGIGPTGMFPFRLQRPAAIATCLSEFGLGVGLLVTAGRIGAGGPALAVRAATALLFWTAVAVLAELRSRRRGVASAAPPARPPPCRTAARSPPGPRPRARPRRCGWR